MERKRQRNRDETDRQTRTNPYLSDEVKVKLLRKSTETQSDAVEIPLWRVAKVDNRLRQYASMLRAEGADDDARMIHEHADALRDIAQTPWTDCSDCGWPGTVLDGKGNVFCDRCETLVVAGVKTE